MFCLLSAQTGSGPSGQRAGFGNSQYAIAEEAA